MLRHWVSALLLVLLLLGSGPALAQAPEDFGGGPVEPPRDLTTDEEWALIEAEVAANIAIIDAGEPFVPQAAGTVSFGWPLRPAPALTDPGYHGVSGFMDHDPDYGQLLDYTCGTRTYDLSGYNHQGVDFFTYPFPWLKMDNRLVEIVAAAPGTLIFKRDGQYDRQCAMTGALSNAVVIRHADGTLAHYLHMKNGSVTTKAVGATIAQGEYLGVVGSSGSSTGPHLHFEVRNAANTTPIDPFHGDCNTSASLWAEQPPYYDSAVIAVHTGTAAPVRPPCPQPEVPNTADTFEPDDTVYFVTTYRDQLAGQQSVYRVLRPDGTIYRQWTHASTAKHYSVSYWYWAMTLDLYGSPPEGTWIFEVTYQGETYRKAFVVGEPTPPGTIEIWYPNGGEVVVAGTYLSLWWEDTVVGDVSIALLANGAVHTQIAAATPSDGVHFWPIPADQEIRSDYTVRIAEVANPQVFAVSQAAFEIAPPPAANFSAYPILSTAPLTVTFSDRSVSAVPLDRWLWVFGDGVTSTLQHPLHTYAALGAYTVTLTVGAGELEDTLVKPGYIRAVSQVWPAYLPLVTR